MQNPYAGAQNIGHQLGRALGNLFFGGGEAERAARRELLEDRLTEAKLAQLLEQTALTRESAAEKRQASAAAAQRAQYEQLIHELLHNYVQSGNTDGANLANTMLKPGSTYQPLEHIGNTGWGYNAATGQSMLLSPQLAQTGQRSADAQIMRDRAAAGASAASAYLSNTRAAGERHELEFAKAHGYKMPTGQRSLSDVDMLQLKSLVDDPLGGKKLMFDPHKVQAFTDFGLLNNADINSPATMAAWRLHELLNPQPAPAPQAQRRSGITQIDLPNLPN